MGIMEQILNQLQELNEKMDNLPAGEKKNREMIDVKEAAEFLTMSEYKVRQEIRKGNIPSIKYGGRIVIPKWKLIERINGELDQKEDLEQLEKVEMLR